MRKEIKGSVVLVTGGAGFIGSHLVDRLLDEGARKVIVVDNLFLGNRDNLSAACERGALFLEADAEDRSFMERTLKAHEVDIVFNLATKALNYSFIDPLDAFETNVIVIGNLLELQRQGLFTTLCHFSSSEVYGTALYEPMDEKHPYNPTTTYAGGKAAADIMLKTYVNMFQNDAFIVRPFNNYGPRQNHKPPLAGIIPLTAKRILEGEAPQIHGTGKQSRDFIYVLDTVDAVLRLYDKVAPGDEVNISADSMITMEDIITKIGILMGYEGEIVRKPRRGADVDCHHATNAKLQGLIDFCPRGFDDGLALTIDWYKERLR
jgi:UDP-glucose 4-epimerase